MVKTRYVRWVILFVLLFGCDRRPAKPPRAEGSAPTSPGPTAGPVWDDTPLDWSRPIPVTPPGGLAEPGYVGADACTPCHEEIAREYARHSMAKTGIRPLSAQDQRWLAAVFDAGARAPVRHAESGFWYRPFREGDRYFVEESLRAADGTPLSTVTLPVTHTLSAGTYGLAFYFRRGDKLYHLPIDYFAKLGRFDLDPFASASNPRFFTTLEPYCLSCHSDYPRRSATVQDVFYEPLPPGIGCERCHGPGARHVETLRPEDVVNPARLSPARQLDVCSQCHLQRYSVARADRHPFAYRPGEPLAAHRMSFLADPPEPERIELLGHSERMVRSACFTESKGKLTCTSCHDPHRSSREQRPAWWRAKCGACHDDAACTELPEVRAAAGDDCVRCHMRPGPTADVPLVTVTDHFIQRRPPPVRTGPARPQRLVPWSEILGEAAAGDDLAAVRAVAHGEAGLDGEARRMAIEALPARPRLAELYDLLANQLRLDARGRARVAAAILRFDPDLRGALIRYALAQLEAGGAESVSEAGRAIARLLALDPEDPSALELEGKLALLDGREDDARALFQRVAETAPTGAASRVGLAAIALRGRRYAEAIPALEAARGLAPADPWILAKLVESYRATGAGARADELAALAPKLPRAERHAASAWLPPAYR